MKPLTENQKTRIVNNVLRAVKDIHKLNKSGYNFLYLASGFIAHYNMYGFIANYTNNSLRDDILQNAEANMWRNFRPGEGGYEYYQAKADVYKRILAGI